MLRRSCRFPCSKTSSLYMHAMAKGELLISFLKSANWEALRDGRNIGPTSIRMVMVTFKLSDILLKYRRVVNN